MVSDDNLTKDTAEINALISMLDTPTELKELEVEFEDFMDVSLCSLEQALPEISASSKQSIINSLLHTLETALEIVTKLRKRGFDEPAKVAKLEGLAMRVRDLLKRIETVIASMNRQS